MLPVLTRCGYRCDLCLAYRPNVESNPSNQQKLSDGWYHYFGFRIDPDHILCDGCMADQPILIDQSCPVRPCVMARNLDNCSSCPDFSCDRFKERMVVFEEIKSRLGVDIPEEDYLNYIRPYENKSRLDHYRLTGEIS